jgi:hypothetical protein
MSDLDDLLERARTAEPGDRILLRDAIVAHGELAIDAMTEWLGDARLAAFAVRVLEFIAREAGVRQAVVDVLESVDREDAPAAVAGDIDRALAALTKGLPRPRARSGGAGGRPVPSPGVPGRGYWLMRTSQWERGYVWAEARRGRLRQGWGSVEEQNLDVIAEARRRGQPLTEAQRYSWPSHRMRVGAQDSMQLDDLVVAANLPNTGELSVFRVAGDYTWSMAEPRRWGERFGHILPVELLVAGVNRHGPQVSDTLRAATRLQPRLYSIRPYGGEVERLVERARAGRAGGGE